MTYLVDHLDKVLALTFIHLRLALAPVLIALVLAVPLGLVVHRSVIARRVTAVAGSVVFTIPSIALFIILPSLINTRILSEYNVIVALAVYATALLARAVPEALDAVPADALEAARAIGYRPSQILLKVQLPLSIPVLIASIRVVSVTNISLVSMGAVIGFGGLGKLFTEGYGRNYPEEIIAGIIAVVVLAFLIDLGIVILGRSLTPWQRHASARRRGVLPARIRQGVRT